MRLCEPPTPPVAITYNAVVRLGYCHTSLVLKFMLLHTELAFIGEHQASCEESVVIRACPRAYMCWHIAESK